MEDLKLGPNGGLVYCMEYLEANIDWLLDRLETVKEKYLLFDLPGQVELFTNNDSLKNIVHRLEKEGYRLCVINLCDSHYCVDPSKFISMLMVSLKTMLQLASPQLNVLSKIDLVESYGSLDFNLDYYTQVQDLSYLLDRLDQDPFSKKYRRLSAAICELVQDFGLVGYLTLCIENKESVLQVLKAADVAIGYVDAQVDKDNSTIMSSVSGWETWDRMARDMADHYLAKEGDGAADGYPDLSRSKFTMTPLYTATSTGGRSGQVKTSDKVINVGLAMPKGLGGPETAGKTNPEQLFAAGYSACFMGAIGAVARGKKTTIDPSSTCQALVSIGKTEDGNGLELSTELVVTLPGLAKDKAKEIVAAAHEVCPYSKVSRRALLITEKPLLGRPGNNLKMGIVGLPNVGKSSFFNSLTNSSVPSENFPFCTIDPSESRVLVPDTRFDWLVDFYKPKSVIPASLTVIDIAGLVKGAAEGQGLGNAFLSHIKAVDGIFHLCRAFDDADIVHVEGDIDPLRDLKIIHEELRLKDQELIDKMVNNNRRDVERLGKGGDASAKEKKEQFETLLKIQKWVCDEKRDVRDGEWTGKEIEYINTLLLITAKPVVYLVNLSEKDFARKKNKWLLKIKAWIDETHPGDIMIPFSGIMEEQLSQLQTTEEKLEYLNELKTKHAVPAPVTSVLPKIVVSGYNALALQYCKFPRLTPSFHRRSR
ncbi:hypothetical protein HDU91_001091 [Kappamyces sp. JEL0680]|nr:hypothetical protein HDU91_001091 [Kappamyces sp. JEL0680]